MKIKFIDKNFSQESQGKIAVVNKILDEYAGQGYTLSLRQLYYQMVARGYIENSLRSYKRLVGLVGDGRLAGLIPWNMITDRNRETVFPPVWESPADIVRAAAEQFRIDKWDDQPTHVEVMVEKDALSGVLGPVCRQQGIGFTANKGYNSLSNMFEAGRRILRHLNAGRDVCILYLGDHDPSGIDMTRDIIDRLELFAGSPIEVKRLALNYDQIEVLNPPENPAKETDSRYTAYVVEFGESSWELDAIEPAALAELVTRAIDELRDNDLWEEALERENQMRAQLEEFVNNYKNL